MAGRIAGVLVGILLGVMASPAMAQSLADVARQEAARRIAEHGSFAGLADTASFDELNGLFETPRTR